MKHLPLLLVIALFSCKPGINYPEGGFDYPINVTGKDTNYYSYPLLSIIPEHERFGEYFQHLFYQPFDEPNLSIKPLAKETFRLTYSEGMGSTIIISFNEDEITIKKGTAGGMYDRDTTKLNKLENAHLNLLERWFPFETKGHIPSLKQHLDSLSSLYPQLLDANYFITLMDKVTTRNKEKFIYQTKKIPITKKEFRSMVEKINASDYWKLMHRVECEDMSADGHSFTLEANTLRKYKTVNGGCPSDKTHFPKLCQKIIVFAGLENEVDLDPDWEPVIVQPDSTNL